MITCPWCGTNYAAFQTNCRNCGGPLPYPAEALTSDPAPRPALPPAPRPIADSYAWRLLGADGIAIVAFVFALLGAIFSVLGAGLIIGIVTALVGLPFFGLGLMFLTLGGGGLAWRWNEARQLVAVLRDGTAAEGEIVDVQENLMVRVNHRHPWTITYRFAANGRAYQGAVRTLNRPGPGLQPGQPAVVLYLPAAPDRNALYPHP